RRPARERDRRQRLAALPIRSGPRLRPRPRAEVRARHVQDRHRPLASCQRSWTCLGAPAAAEVLEQIAEAGGGTFVIPDGLATAVAYPVRPPCVPPIVPTAMPPTINPIANSSDSVTGSPSSTTAAPVPTTGVARRPSEVVIAGRLRLTMAMAQ